MNSPEPELGVAHRRILTNGVTLHVATAGPEDGPLVILLHGFPEFWFGWRQQIEPLAAAGFRVWVPDQRGYNLSEKPGRVSDYNLDRLAEDVVGLIDAAGAEKAFLVGHDWGAAVAWWVAMKHRERVTRLAILNVPHPIVMRRYLLRSFTQLKKSWYMGMFQLPWLGEFGLTRNGGVPMSKGIRNTAQRGAFTEEDLERYREAWLQPGAATGMINWYRAGLRSPGKMPKDIRIHVPTLIIWGTADAFLGEELAPMSLEVCTDGRLERLEGVSHWVQHEAPERVNALLIEHFFEPRPSTRSSRAPAGRAEPTQA
jgi:pimeloyl-ACP methyl ester carboxylesterase